MRSLAMNYLKGEGRSAFLKLIETADVLIEASVGGRFASKGLGDEKLWEVNPRLVIAHISGYILLLLMPRFLFQPELRIICRTSC